MLPRQKATSRTRPQTPSRTSTLRPVVFTPSKGGSLRPQRSFTDASKHDGSPSHGRGKMSVTRSPKRLLLKSKAGALPLTSFPDDVIVLSSDTESDSPVPITKPSKISSKACMNDERVREWHERERLLQELEDTRRRLQQKELALKREKQENKSLKEINDTMKATDNAMQDYVAALEASVEAKQTKSNGKRTLDDTMWEEEATCEMCYILMWDPVTTQCGHTFCKGCLQEWFSRQKSKHITENPAFAAGFIPDPILDAISRRLICLDNPHYPVQYVMPEGSEIEVIKARQIVSMLRKRWELKNPSPEYTCPKCRHRITEKPCCVLLVKNMVSKVAKVLGEDEPEQAGVRRADAHAGWEQFFPSNRN